MRQRSGPARFADLDTVGLLELVRAGDKDAYGELYVRYHDFARRVARRASRRHADDLVAEAFRRILTAISRGAGPTEAFGPYLATTIRSAAAGLAAPYQEVEFEVTADVAPEHADVDPRVSTAYVSLPEAWQNALWYSDVEGLSPRQAAPLMGLPSANAYSALRLRARAGLRSAYLTQVVDEACNEEVRHQLQLLIAGKTTPEEVDRAVDEHVGECDECAAIAWRVAAVTGNKLGLALAPALLAFHGFAASSSLLPVGLGMTGLLGWLYRTSRSVVAGATAVAVATVGLLVVGILAIAGVTGDEPPPPTTTAAVTDDTDDGSAVVPPPPTTSEPTSSTSTTSSTTSTSTSSTTSTSTTGPTTTSSSSTTAPTTTAPTTTAPTTTAPTTTAPPVVVVTTTPRTTTTAPRPTTTTTPPATTTTTVPPTTTTTTTTTVPVVPPGDLVVVSDELGPGASPKRDVAIVIENLTGEPGSLVFSLPISNVSVTNAVCPDEFTCLLGGVEAPEVVNLSFRSDREPPITIDLLDSAGNVVQTYTSPTP